MIGPTFAFIFYKAEVRAMKVILVIFLLGVSSAQAADLSQDDINLIRKCISFVQAKKFRPHSKPQDPRLMLQGRDLPIFPTPGGHSSNPNQPLNPRPLTPGEARPKPINPEEFE